ncbi:prostatic acid phosphatase-like isoform X2 [Contarinia nasturtii]|uniref:prostatic acid phosphatase-like isoform X2 n=1 Tax=Contarinia nasturtii TaxID=265458 RepID=UPI0012D3AEAB|nr:prostatic acid phosphatase-like isoform X2 [Contarinia nasturtii]
MLSCRVVSFVFLLFCVFDVFSHDDVNSLEDKSAIWPSNDSQLIFAHVIYRHGHRNTLDYSDIYPNDPYINETHWPGGFGALTNEGKRQQFKLGQYFRRRYHKLLGDKYSPKKVFVRSTDKDRTLMSALANLAGLFPPHAEEKWHEDIAWQPIPVHTIPLNLDYVLRGSSNCPRYSAALNLTTIDDLYCLYDVLLVQSFHNKTLPDWARKAIEPNGALESINDFSFKMLTITKELARLRSGFLIKEMFQRFAKKINSTLEPNCSLWFYSGHDGTVASLLDSLGVFEAHLPPFASSVHLELYKVGEEEHYIQIFYRKSEEEILLPLNIPNCGEKCSLNQLYNLYNDIIPDHDHDTECRLTN